MNVFEPYRTNSFRLLLRFRSPRGNVRVDETYGYASYDPTTGKGVFSLRNPDTKQSGFRFVPSRDLDIPPSAPKASCVATLAWGELNPARGPTGLRTLPELWSPLPPPPPCVRVPQLRGCLQLADASSPLKPAAARRAHAAQHPEQASRGGDACPGRLAACWPESAHRQGWHTARCGLYF